MASDIPRLEVKWGPPEVPHWRVEQITDTAGCRLTGGSGASGWGYNQSNLVRCFDDLYALSWRDDLTLCVFRRLSRGTWEAGPVLPPVPQNGNLLIDSHARLHVIGGDRASWHLRFDDPGRLDRFELCRRVSADSRFGAAIDNDDRILVGGGLEQLGWYVLDGADNFACAARGQLRHDRQRGYHFVLFNDGQAHTLCSDDYFLPGDDYPNQQVRLRDPATGVEKTVETPCGIYPVLRVYYYHNPDLLTRPDDWRMTVIGDVADSFRPAPAGDGARGTSDQQDLYLDRQGQVHLLYYENRQRSREVWAGTGQDVANSRLYHAIGPPGGPFEHRCLGAFNGGRLVQTRDGRCHYLLTRGRRSAAESLWYCVGEAGDWARLSEPVPLDTGGPFWHLFVNAPRFGGHVEDGVDAYWHGPLGGDSNLVRYGQLTAG